MLNKIFRYIFGTSLIILNWNFVNILNQSLQVVVSQQLLATTYSSSSIDNTTEFCLLEARDIKQFINWHVLDESCLFNFHLAKSASEYEMSFAHSLLGY